MIQNSALNVFSQKIITNGQYLSKHESNIQAIRLIITVYNQSSTPIIFLCLLSSL